MSHYKDHNIAIHQTTHLTQQSGSAFKVNGLKVDSHPRNDSSLVNVSFVHFFRGMQKTFLSDLLMIFKRLLNFSGCGEKVELEIFENDGNGKFL